MHAEIFLQHPPKKHFFKKCGRMTTIYCGLKKIRLNGFLGSGNAEETPFVCPGEWCSNVMDAPPPGAASF
jgi:hypothetical protein